MKIPNYENVKLVDKDGYLTPEWQKILNQLFTELQNNAGDEGIKVPQQDNTNIAILNNTNSTGTLIYDSSSHKLKVNLNGTFKEIVTL